MDTLTSLKSSFGVIKETYRHYMLARAADASYPVLKKSWAENVLDRMRVEVEVVGSVNPDHSVLLIGNHVGYVDIPLLMKVAPDISFVAKAEIASWPVFGTGARMVETIFVKRENGDSRTAARIAIKEGLESGKRIVLFPSGTTSISESVPWRRGAFEIAQEIGVKIQPFRMSFSPLRAAAYIDDDFLPIHLFKLGKLPRIQAKIEFHDPVAVVDPASDAVHWQEWTQVAVREHAL